MIYPIPSADYEKKKKPKKKITKNRSIAIETTNYRIKGTRERGEVPENDDEAPPKAKYIVFNQNVHVNKTRIKLKDLLALLFLYTKT